MKQISYSIDKNLFPDILIEKPKIITFCYIAHPFILKGLHYLLDAWRNINLKYPNVELLIGGNLSPSIKELIQSKYSSVDRVKYLGWVEKLNEFYRKSHVAIVPSLLDAGPGTIIEAMWCGLPVITTFGCGASILVENGKNGYVVEAGYAQALEEKIEWFIQNSEQIGVMGERAHDDFSKELEKENNKHIADHLIEVIEKIGNDNENIIGR